LLVGDPKGITDRDVGRVQNLRLRQWRRTHPPAGGPQGQGRTGGDHGAAGGRARQQLDLPGLPPAGPQAQGPPVPLSPLWLAGASGSGGCLQLAAKAGGGDTSTAVSVLVEHRRAGVVPARRDRRRHLHDQRRRSCLAPGHPAAAAVAVWVSLVSCRVVSCGWRGSDSVAQPSKRCLKGH
jgi:hypothetical protein